MKFNCWGLFSLLVVLLIVPVIQTQSETVTPSFSQSVSTTVTPTLTPTFYGASRTPAPSTSPVTTASNETLSIIVFLDCVVETTVCCADFPGLWASFVNVNDPELVEVTACAPSQSNGVKVTYTQTGTNFHSVDEIINDYWGLAGCQNLDHNTDGACYPTTTNLASEDWSNVNAMEVDNDYYVPIKLSVSKTPEPSRTSHVSPTPRGNVNDQEDKNQSSDVTIFSSIFILVLFTLIL